MLSIYSDKLYLTIFILYDIIISVSDITGGDIMYPLTEAVYYILLSLYQPMHGYGIMQNVAKLSDGRVTLAAGTLYGALNTLLERDWVQSVVMVSNNEINSRRKEYLITDIGKTAVMNEIGRLKELVANGEAITGGVNYEI